MTEPTRIQIQDRQLLSHVWAKLEQISFNYQHSDGRWETQTREVYHRGHGAAVLLYNRGQRTVVLVRQFRLPVFETENGGGFLLEVPAGVIDGNDAEATVREETEQETGFSLSHPVFLFSAYVSPGSVTERIHYYMAEFDPSDRPSSGGGLASEGEDIEVLIMPFDEAMTSIESGAIRDAKTILLLQHAALTVFS